jgi:hypothetical protein
MILSNHHKPLLLETMIISFSYPMIGLICEVISISDYLASNYMIDNEVSLFSITQDVIRTYGRIEE